MTTTAQIQTIAKRISESSRCSYKDIYLYLNEAVTVYGIELPDPDILDYTVTGAFVKLLKWVELQKRDKICAPAVPEGAFVFDRPSIKPILVRNTTPQRIRTDAPAETQKKT